MKKIVSLLVLLGCMCVTLLANHPYNPPIIATEDSCDVTCEGTICVTVLSVSSTTMEVLVDWSNDLDAFCDYFNDSWLDAGLTLYCAFAGTGVYGECIIHRVIKATCGLNKVFLLTMQGDISSAIKQGLKTGAQIYSIAKQSDKVFTLTEAMCKIEDRR